MINPGRKVFALAIAAALVYVAGPLLLPVAMGGVLSVLFIPWLELLERRLPTRVASALLTLAITLVLVLPSAFLVYAVAKTGVQQLHELRETPKALSQGWVPAEAGTPINAILRAPKVRSLMVWATSWVPVTMADLEDTAADLIRGVGVRLADLFGDLVAHLPGMAIGMVIVVVSVYFFLVDGRRLSHFVRRNSVFEPEETEQLLETLSSTCRSVILASVVSGTVQALFETLACLGAGVPQPAFAGALVFMASFIPVVGALPVTLGVAAQAWLGDHTGASVFLLFCAVIVAALDNTIRPLFLRGSANLNPLLAFVAAFGGLQTLGFLGIFLGPIIAAMFVVTVRVLTHGREAAANG
jgi:predicted PurR-regulated permease PerM